MSFAESALVSREAVGNVIDWWRGMSCQSAVEGYSGGCAEVNSLRQDVFDTDLSIHFDSNPLSRGISSNEQAPL